MATAITSIVGPQIKTKNGTIDANQALSGKKLVAFYCSAHWCPPCRAFTPMLKELYKNWQSNPETSSVEVVFVSSDRDEKSFKTYWNEHPWPAIPYESRDEKDKIARNFSVMSIPALIVVDAETGQVVDREGRQTVIQRKGDSVKYWQQLAASKK